MLRKPPPLATLRSALLGWPGSGAASRTIDLTLQPASAGGHVLLGRNGAGKTLLGSALVNATETDGGSGWVHGGSLERREGWSARSVSHVSFESHEALLDEGGSVYRALGVPPGATPNKAAQFLIVRFGLHGLLYRQVSAISTGEIRKVLLARALATRPSLLILDNAFDGLDVPSRCAWTRLQPAPVAPPLQTLCTTCCELRGAGSTHVVFAVALAELISTTLKGFGNLLVQGVDARATAHTQVLLITHRAEEIVDEVATASYFLPSGELVTVDVRCSHAPTVHTLPGSGRC